MLPRRRLLVPRRALHSKKKKARKWWQVQYLVIQTRLSDRFKAAIRGPLYTYHSSGDFLYVFWQVLEFGLQTTFQGVQTPQGGAQHPQCHHEARKGKGRNIIIFMFSLEENMLQRHVNAHRRDPTICHEKALKFYDFFVNKLSWLLSPFVPHTTGISLSWHQDFFWAKNLSDSHDFDSFFGSIKGTNLMRSKVPPPKATPPQ